MVLTPRGVRVAAIARTVARWTLGTAAVTVTAAAIPTIVTLTTGGIQ